MAKKIKTPGIYIQESPVLPPAISSVETAIPAFTGYTEKAERSGESLLLKPTKISTIVEFENYFGGRSPLRNISVVIDDMPDPEVQEIIIPNTEHYLLYDCLSLFFANGGGDCYIVSVGFFGAAPAYGDETDPSNTGLRTGLKALEVFDEPTLLLFPDAVNVVVDGSDDPGFYHLQQMALQQCGKLQDRFCIFDLKENITGDHASAVENFRNNIGSSHVKFGAAYSPFLVSSCPFEPDINSFINKIFNQKGENISLRDLSTTPAETDLLNSWFEETDEALKKALQPMIYRGHRLISKIVKEIKTKVCTIPPSGAIAGIYTSVDRSRGVWKAPANVSLNSVIRLTHNISSREQESLNVHSSGKSINAIRYFPGKGNMVWGARTLAGNDNEWRYVPVRRLFNMVEESVKKGCIKFVFEPNDRNTWTRVKSMIENYLAGLWREGGLAGAKPEDAFFVKVGLHETMTEQDILEGQMIIVIGMAVARPAEFIILRITQQQESS